MTKPSGQAGPRGGVTLARGDLVQALIVAADVMQNTAAVAKSQDWKSYYHDAMNKYRNAAVMIERGAKLSIKS